jgi:hypothetical protein
VERAREVQQLEDGVVIRVPSSDAVVRTMTQATPRASYPRAPMVGWYNPVQLARTGISIITSTLFGRNADRRLLEALRAAPIEYTDYSVVDGAARREIWLDYVADSGDGFDPTFAVASAVARETLELVEPPPSPGTRGAEPTSGASGASGASGEPAPRRHLTQRGRVLVFGGDLVYPVASRECYEQRLVMPYEHALSSSGAPHPDVYAVPGNHDWYDSLIAFTRRFCSKRWFAGWRTHQRVSYFALQLPQDWWLIGTDVQLESDVDAEQVNYFKAIAERMTDRSRIILCNSEPHWIYEKKYAEIDNRYADSNLRFLEEKIFDRKVAVFLSGDLHHYRRHSDDEHHHKITAGGGGAFLHPTHDANVDELPGATAAQPYRLKRSYPTVETSRALTWRTLMFPVLNPRFGLVTALIYLLTCQAVQIDLSKVPFGDIGTAAGMVLYAVLRSPIALVWVLLVIGGIVLFTDTHSTRYRIFGGLSHATAHLASVFFIGWGAARIVAPWGLTPALDLLAIGALVFAAGWLAGALVMGLYLFVSLNGFGRHHNEAFSALAIPDWKNFLRLHITTEGALEIYPVGIDRVPRRWRASPNGPHWESCDPAATPPRLIEPPIVIPAIASTVSRRPGAPATERS